MEVSIKCDHERVDLHHPADFISCLGTAHSIHRRESSLSTIIANHLRNELERFQFLLIIETYLNH